MFKMAPFRINSLDFGNSYLNCTYSIKFLIKIKKQDDFKILQEKNSQENFQIMFQIGVPNKKIQGEEPMLCS